MSDHKTKTKKLKQKTKTLRDGRNPLNSSFARVGRVEKSTAGSNSSVPPTQWVFVLCCIVQQHVSIALFTTSTHDASAAKRSKEYRSGKWGIQSFCDIWRASQPRRSKHDSTLVWAGSQHLLTPARNQGARTFDRSLGLVWHQLKHQGYMGSHVLTPRFGGVKTRWQQQKHQGYMGSHVLTLWFGRCQNTLTSARTPRLYGFTCPYASVWRCQNTLTTAKTPRLHGFTCPNALVWAVSKHADISKNSKATWVHMSLRLGLAVSKHADNSKNTKAAWVHMS